MSSNVLARSNQNRMIAGVMGGIADRFGLDATLVRIVFVLVSMFSVAVPGILIYLILWVIMPLAPNPPSSYQPPYQQ